MNIVYDKYFEAVLINIFYFVYMTENVTKYNLKMNKKIKNIY